ncbi:unnamed protein product [Staurois parvus]|uniref:Uncharacterized protein n=1 Tax=Staurois parvus TaxID=386267 RepID=A0ABN9EPN3_9NEOB|nr:unnamed protein product [Staurois parvus]
MANVRLEFKASAGDGDPQTRPILILGQLPNLQRLLWAEVRGKLQPRVTEEVWKGGLSSLSPNPTDSCPHLPEPGYHSSSAIPSQPAQQPFRSSLHHTPDSELPPTWGKQMCPYGMRALRGVCQRLCHSSSLPIIHQAF